MKGQPNIAVRIYDAIKTAMQKIAAYFKGDAAALARIEEYQQLARGRRMFEKALNTRNLQGGVDGELAYALKFLTEKDINEYLNTGIRKNINKRKAYDRGEKVITYKQQRSSFVY